MRFTIQRKFLAGALLIVSVSLIAAGLLTMVLAERDAPVDRLLSPVMLGTLFGAAALAALLSVPVSRRLTRSLKEIIATAGEFAKGKLDGRVPLRSDDELSDLGGILNQMAAQLQDQIGRVTEDRARLQAILEGMVEGVLVLDRKGAVLLVNPALERMFEVRSDFAVGRLHIETLRHHALVEFIKDLLDTGANRSSEITIPYPKEAIFSVHASVVPESAAQEVYAVLVFHEITEIKRLERVRKDFVANVSHELKTPLTSIKGYLEALIDGAKDDPQKAAEFLAVAKKHADGLAAIVSDLLQLSEIESGRYSWKREPVSVGEMIDRAANLVRSAATSKRHELIVTPPKPDIRIPGDPDKLGHVMINLLDNAVKYTPDGGRITVNARRFEDDVEITVSDTGIGIPAAERARIFERFYRVDRARSRDLGGTGLGLAIVKHIVEAHGGRVWVDREPQGGSRFVVSLPQRPINTSPAI